MEIPYGYPLICDSICNSTSSHKFKSFINDIYIYNINSDLFGNRYFFITILKCSTSGLLQKKFTRLNYLILSVINITAGTFLKKLLKSVYTTFASNPRIITAKIRVMNAQHIKYKLLYCVVPILLSTSTYYNTRCRSSIARLILMLEIPSHPLLPPVHLRE